MKQLYYTSCRAGRSVSGAAGYQVRAASAEMGSEALALARAAARYQLPAGVRESAPPEQVPPRLSLVDGSDGLRALCHAVYVGADAETGRTGNYFSHAVVGRAAELDPLTAIRTWGAAFWRTRDADGPTALPDAPAALAAGPDMADADLPAVVARHRGEVEFLLGSLVAAGPDGQVYLAAPPAVVARALAAALAALPPVLRAAVTFSTGESDPLAAGHRVVGTDWDSSLARDLPAQCYADGFAMNTRSGARSDPWPLGAAFVSFAVAALADGRLDALHRFHAVCARGGAADGAGVAALARLILGPGPLAPADLARPEAPRVLPDLLARPGLAAQLADLALADPAFRERVFPQYVAGLAARPDVLAQLTDAAWQAGLAAAAADDVAALRTAWCDVLPVVAPRPPLGERVLRAGVAPDRFPPRVRDRMADAVLDVATDPDDPRVAAWAPPRPKATLVGPPRFADTKACVGFLKAFAAAPRLDDITLVGVADALAGLPEPGSEPESKPEAEPQPRPAWVRLAALAWRLAGFGTDYRPAAWRERVLAAVVAALVKVRDRAAATRALEAILSHLGPGFPPDDSGGLFDAVLRRVGKAAGYRENAAAQYAVVACGLGWTDRPAAPPAARDRMRRRWAEYVSDPDVHEYVEAGLVPLTPRTPQTPGPR